MQTLKNLPVLEQLRTTAFKTTAEISHMYKQYPGKTYQNMRNYLVKQLMCLACL